MANYTPSDSEVINWASTFKAGLKRYDFNSISQDKPTKVADVDIEVVGVDATGNLVVLLATDDVGQVVKVDQPALAEQHDMWGVFTSEETAIKVSKRHFNQEKAEQLTELQRQKAELEEQIKALEDELS